MVSLIGLNAHESGCDWLKNVLSNKIGLNVASIVDENDVIEGDTTTSCDDFIFDWKRFFS